MKNVSAYGNCQIPTFLSFLNINPAFRKNFQYYPLRECHLISETEIDNFIKNEAEKIDLFIYVPVSDNYRDNYKFSSNFLISHLRPDCIIIVFPVLYYPAYDPQMTYLTDESGKRITVPHDYHDKFLVKIFIENRHLTNEKIFLKYLAFIKNPENFNKTEIQNAVLSYYRELKRREDLLDKDKRNHFVIRVADFIDKNYKNQRLFYTFHHPSKNLYLYMRQQLFGYLDIKTNEPDFDPDWDPQIDFVFGIFPPIKNILEIRFEDDDVFPSNIISYTQYLNYYRSFNPKIFIKSGFYPIIGCFSFNSGWSVDEKTHRWAESKEALMMIYNDQNVSANYHLIFNIFVIKPQRIKISLNDVYSEDVDFTCGERSLFIHMDVWLDPGENRLKIFSDTSPAKLDGKDTRTLSFAIAQFSAIKENEISLHNNVKDSKFIISRLNQDIASKDLELQKITTYVTTLNQAIASKDQQLIDVATYVTTLNQAIASKDLQLQEIATYVTNLNQAIASKDHDLMILTTQVQSLEQKISVIETSIVWQLKTKFHRKIIGRVLPQNTRR